MQPPKHIKLEELQNILNEQHSSLGPRELNWWLRNKVNPYTAVRRDRTQSHYVVAQVKNRIIFFADDEDEFAIGSISESGEIDDFGLMGDLVDAVRSVVIWSDK